MSQKVLIAREDDTVPIKLTGLWGSASTFIYMLVYMCVLEVGGGVSEVIITMVCECI